MGRYSANARYICFFKEGAEQPSYYQIKKNRYKCLDAACFSTIRSYETDLVFTRFTIQKVLKPEAIDFYVEFLGKILDKKKYRTRVSKDKKYFFLLLNSKNISTTHKVLLYLTAFRYFQEFPEIINDFYEKKTGDVEKDFILFQEIHRDFDLNKKHLTYNNLSGHGLIYQYSFDNPTFKYKPISLKAFQNKLNNNTGINVQQHFF